MIGAACGSRLLPSLDAVESINSRAVVSPLVRGPVILRFERSERAAFSAESARPDARHSASNTSGVYFSDPVLRRDIVVRISDQQSGTGGL